MADSVRASNVWSLNGTQSTLACGKFSGNLDIARPDAGLHQREFDYNTTPCTFLGVMRAPEMQGAVAQGDKSWWPLAVADSYIRGNDLVATYQPSDAWPYAPQIYWRANASSPASGALASMSLLVSVQTHLLDTHPNIVVASQVPSSELFHISFGDDNRPKPELIASDRTIASGGKSCCLLWRLISAPLSYVEFAPSSDFQKIICSPGPPEKPLAKWHLFSEFLEKGVIRRARVHGALLPRKNDIELAIECCSIFEHSPLPLTA